MAESLPERELTDVELVAFNAEVNAAVSETARVVRFADVLVARGDTTVALDDEDRPRRYHPDGTTSLLLPEA